MSGQVMYAVCSPDTQVYVHTVQTAEVMRKVLALIDNCSAEDDITTTEIYVSLGKNPEAKKPIAWLRDASVVNDPWENYSRLCGTVVLSDSFNTGDEIKTSQVVAYDPVKNLITTRNTNYFVYGVIDGVENLKL